MSSNCGRYKKICRNTILCVIGIVLLVVGIIGYRIWQTPWYLEQLLRTKDDVIADCQESWKSYIELSQEIEARLQVVMPTPERYIVIKSGDSDLGSYSFAFFGIDSMRGYLLMNSYGYPGLFEKPYARTEAQTLFDDLTQGYDADITGYSNLGSVHPHCNFMKIAFPTSSKELQFIGFSSRAPKGAVGVKLLKKALRFFGEHHHQIRLGQTQEEREKAIWAAFFRDRNAGRTLADFDNQGKRAIENTFFELP